MAITPLYEYQIDAITRMKTGCVLCGGVGSGKSLTAIGYYYIVNGGDMDSLCGSEYFPMNDPPIPLYIITTARKRDAFEWEKELSPFLLSTVAGMGLYSGAPVVIDSWNNIHKYTDVNNAFFIFDEQRVVGKGVWVKSFLKIAGKNDWIMLSATPGDTWVEYIPLFIANGFYRNRTQFEREHVIYSPRTKFPKIERYVNVRKLERLRDSILVDMDFTRQTRQYHKELLVSYDVALYKTVSRERWDIWENKPIENAGSLCYALRKVVNTDISRVYKTLEIAKQHPRIIIFYNFDYELNILKNIQWQDGTKIAQWNGHKHESIPDAERWVYLVNYYAGAEGWNCIETDTILFYSQNYSYKIMMQAAGRIDRVNTPFQKLYYYYLKSLSGIDEAISETLKKKENFNENRYVQKAYPGTMFTNE